MAISGKLSTQTNREITGLFLKLGLTAFGGPAAHIAMFRHETVVRRKWLSDQEFLDLLGATNLIPGPNSTEMAIHLGYLRGGWVGLILAGVCFIFPAMISVTALAWLYVRFGTLPQANWLLYGVKPVVIAIIAQALFGLGQRAVKDWLTAAVGAASLAFFLLGGNPLLALFGGGVIIMSAKTISRWKTWISGAVLLPLLGQNFQIPAAPLNLQTLFLTFLKIGSVLYGSGYVLLAFLQSDFVVRLGWLTNQQIIDAVAIGQITPGPVFTTATFIGYILGGLPGAGLATLGIFLPSFLLVAISNPLIPKLRGLSWAGSLLDGVNVASLGLMAAVTIELARSSITDLTTALAALVAGILLIKLKTNTTWLILGGAVIGCISMLVR